MTKMSTSKSWTGKIGTLVLIALQFVTLAADAAIPHALRTPVHRDYILKRSFDFSRGFDIMSIQRVESLRTTRSEDISRIIPANMTPTNDGGLIATQILDHSLSNWFNSEAVRTSSFGRTAHAVEKSMEGDVAFGGTQPESIKHQLKFSMRATQTRADIEYTGLTHAQLTYFIIQERTNVEVREQIDMIGTQLVYNHISSKDDTRQMVSVRWDW